MKEHRYSVKYLMLTYSQVKDDFDPKLIVAKARAHKAKYHISRELHQDGGVHYHALFMFDKRFQSRNTKAFNIGIYHPHWLLVRAHPWKSWDYVGKDGDIIETNMERPDESVLKNPAANQLAWATILGTKTKEEFWETAKALQPKAVITQYPALLKYSNDAFNEDIDVTTAEHPGFLMSDQTPAELKAWVDGFKAGQAAAADENGDTRSFTVRERLAIHAMIYLNI